MSTGYTKAELEDAIVSALAPLSVQGGGYLRALSAYRGELSRPGLAHETLQMPCVFAAYSSSSYRPGPCLYADETLSFNVIAVCRAGAGPGAYEVLKDVRDILCGSTLGLDVTPVRLLRDSSLWSDGDTEACVSAYSISQRVRLLAQVT